MKWLSLALAVVFFVSEPVVGFLVPTDSGRVSLLLPLASDGDGDGGGNEKKNAASWKTNWNPFIELVDMMSSLDDVVDDFLNKRMGNGEVFYGQRKYKPSNRDNTQGSYSGMGMSDRARIDAAREYKEERMEMRRLREQGLRRDD